VEIDSGKHGNKKEEENEPTTSLLVSAASKVSFRFQEQTFYLWLSED
jgi:hypothetical protein